MDRERRLEDVGCSEPMSVDGLAEHVYLLWPSASRDQRRTDDERAIAYKQQS